GRRGLAGGHRSRGTADRRAHGGAGRPPLRVAALEDAVTADAEPPANRILRLEARGLTASYGREPVLRGLDAAIPAGAVAAILGENGSGKSTLLKVFARVIGIRSGEVLLDGEPLDSLPRRRTAQRIAYVPQSVDLVFPIRTLDLVLQGRAPYGRGFVAETAADRRLALEAMRACDVETLAERDAAALSGGERRGRVPAARAGPGCASLAARRAHGGAGSAPQAGVSGDSLESPPGTPHDGRSRHARDRAGGGRGHPGGARSGRA